MLLHVADDSTCSGREMGCVSRDVSYPTVEQMRAPHHIITQGLGVQSITQTGPSTSHNKTQTQTGSITNEDWKTVHVKFASVPFLTFQQ